LQEIYFSGGVFLNALLGRQPSYAWRSIIQARDVMERGLGWRVGNGEFIRIWRDKWLPPPNPILIHNPLQGLDRDSRVSKLIDPHTRWWNFDLIRCIFEPWEVGQICSLVLSPLGHSDQSGRVLNMIFFSVKNAYHLEMQYRNQSRGREFHIRAEGRDMESLMEFASSTNFEAFCVEGV